MAFDEEETNTIVTLHSSGGQGFLQTEALLVQSGWWVTWWNRGKVQNQERKIQIKWIVQFILGQKTKPKTNVEAEKKKKKAIVSCKYSRLIQIVQSPV